MKQNIFREVENLKELMVQMAWQIFDRPETGHKEYFASRLLCDFLTQRGFQTELGLGRQETAFRAEIILGNGEGPAIGLLCEYDALEKMGHACGHHLQGPSICCTAVALKDLLKDTINGKLIVYGTPAEEGGGGKIILLEDGYLQDIDVALMMHGAPTTCVDVKSMAAASYQVTFLGKSAHAALKPEAGRSGLDGLLLAFNGLEFLREHILEDSRIHYTVAELPGPPNVVPEKAIGVFNIRSYNTTYLHEQLIPRFKDVMNGAALMTGTTCEIIQKRVLEGKIPVNRLNELIMGNAAEANAPNIHGPRQKTGSSDFGNVMYRVPGSCIRVAFVPEGSSSHSQVFLDMGKTKEAETAMVAAAKTLAGTAYDILSEPQIMESIKKEFEANKNQMNHSAV